MSISNPQLFCQCVSLVLQACLTRTVNLLYKVTNINMELDVHFVGVRLPKQAFQSQENDGKILHSCNWLKYLLTQLKGAHIGSTGPRTTKIWLLR